LRDFQCALYEAYLAAGTPTFQDLAADAARISDLDPAPGTEVIRACLGEAQLPAQQADAAAIAVILARRAAWNADDFTLLIRGLWLKARLTAPLGQPLRLVTDPFALEVHRAIDHSAGQFPHDLPPLPAYVERPHDEQLRQYVTQALKGTSTMAVLIGPSSTGKTRACWEAVQELPDTWRLWHPIVPGRADAALTGLGGIGPHTVVWLNDTHHYLTTPGTGLGERVAAALRALLREPSQAPVLVLGTIWPEHWAQLVQEPGPQEGGEDPHAQARYLLAGTGVTVPTAFTTADLARLLGQAGRDPRLLHAAQHAEDGRITQYLAGAPALLERYRTAPPAARALIEAAMDARAAGHTVALPHALLEAAAESYLTDAEWDTLGEDWFEQALAYCAAPLRGARGPLTRIRPRRGASAPPQPHYRLADFLEEHGRATRRLVHAPTGFWDALVDHARRPDLTDLAQSAGERGLLAPALRLFTAAYEAGQDDSLRAAGTLLHSAGRIDEAITWYQRANEVGDTASLGLAVTLLYDTGRTEQALAWLTERAHQGDPAAPGWLAQLQPAQ
jgi:tetratricopeptide (TPR) repeat protein